MTDIRDSGRVGHGAGGLISPMRQHYKALMSALSQVCICPDMTLDVAKPGEAPFRLYGGILLDQHNRLVDAVYLLM